MTTTPPDSVVREICDRLAPHASETTHDDRLDAARVLIQRFTGIAPEVVMVRAAIYSRSAAYRLSALLLPSSRGEVEHLREQVGAGVVLLGYDAPHAILLAHGLLIELADASQWNQPGALLRPYATPQPHDPACWTVDGLRYGVQVTYERNATAEPVPLVPSLATHRLARHIEHEMRVPARLRRAN
jgi:hypothetical protein